MITVTHVIQTVVELLSVKRYRHSDEMSASLALGYPAAQGQLNVYETWHAQYDRSRLWYRDPCNKSFGQYLAFLPLCQA